MSFKFTTDLSAEFKFSDISYNIINFNTEFFKVIIIKESEA